MQIKSDNFNKSNGEKLNIAITILERKKLGGTIIISYIVSFEIIGPIFMHKKAYQITAWYVACATGVTRTFKIVG